MTMVIIKCKMCGGDAYPIPDTTYGRCEYCGTAQPMPTANDERMVNLFNHANHLRLHGAFDEAQSFYERLLAEDSTNAEAHWGMVLCRYGIEYVEDPRTGSKMPTCHRTQHASVLADAYYLAAMQYAPDHNARSLYEQEGKLIYDIQAKILAIANNEEPFDIFICYKETTPGGSRTVDSTLAQDLYDKLTKEGFKVFFARITLEDKLGREYEPYIFSALNTAKVMLAIGTRREYFEAIWVKNEWSRYLSLMRSDPTSPRMLIPCYRDMDPYNMPGEFQRLQSQDMGKLGYEQDLIRGIKKIVGVEANQSAAVRPAVANTAAPRVEAMMKRGWLALEDGEWDEARKYFDEALNDDPEHAPAYIGLLCARLCVKTEADLVNEEMPFDFDNDYKKAFRFASEDYRIRIGGYVQAIKERASERQRKHEEDVQRQEVTKSSLAEARRHIAKFRGCIFAGSHTVGLRSNGTVIAVGKNDDGQCNTSNWTGVVAIDAGYSHTVGLKSDGTVVAVGFDGAGQCDTSNWQNIVSIVATGNRTYYLDSRGVFGSTWDWGTPITKDVVAIAASDDHIVGLKSDGTVIASVNPSNSSYGYDDGHAFNNVRFQDIDAIATGGSHTVCLKKDGTVIAVGYNRQGQCDTSDWRDIVAIAVGSHHTVGLKSTGTVVAVGSDSNGKCNTSEWRDIIDIVATSSHTVGLKLDGTVVAVGDNEKGQCNTSKWRDIVAISASAWQTVGLRSDGMVEAIGDNQHGQCNTYNLQDIGPVSKEWIALWRQEEERLSQFRQSQHWLQQGLCRNCGGQISGVFTKKCKSCGSPQNQTS